MNQCNDPDHGAINAERSESRGLRKAWVELDDKRQVLERELTAVIKERDEALKVAEKSKSYKRVLKTENSKLRDKLREEQKMHILTLDEREGWIFCHLGNLYDETERLKKEVAKLKAHNTRLKKKISLP